MKLEALQSLSLVTLIVGLLLSALGAYGTFRFSGENAREQRQEETASADAADPIEGALPAHGGGAEKITAIIEPVIIDPVFVSPEPEPKADAPKSGNGVLAHLPPVGEGPVEAPAEPVKPPVAVTPPLPAVPLPKPIVAAPAKTEPPKSEPPPPAPVAAVEPRAVTPAEKPRHAPVPGLGLAPWQIEKLLLRLRSHSGGVVAIRVPEGNDDALQFAEALKTVFISAGWHVPGVEVVKTPRGNAGITLSSGTFPPPVEVTTVFSALVTAGIKLGTDLDPAQGKNKAVLHIGSRP